MKDKEKVNKTRREALTPLSIHATLMYRPKAISPMPMRRVKGDFLMEISLSR